MPLDVTPKAASVTSATPSRTVSRAEVSLARPSASSARVEALKARLSQPAPAEPVARRPAGSSARAEEMAKLKKFAAPTVKTPQKAVTPARGTASTQDFTAIAPPPSGLAEGGEAIRPNTPTEAPQPPTEATSDEPVDPQFAALARQTQQVRKAQRELKAAQDAWKQDQAKYITRDSLTTDPLKVLAEVGLSPDKLVELQINQSAPQDPQQVLLDQIAELKAQLQGITDPEKGVLAKRDQEAYEQAVTQIKADAQLLVDSNPSFGTIKSEGQTQEVVNLITSVFDEEGIVLDVEEACQLVESKLQEQLDAQYQKLQRYEWLKAKHGKPAEDSAEASPAQPSPTAPRSKPTTTTLTNAGSVTRPLSPRDRAILAVQERINASKGN